MKKIGRYRRRKQNKIIIISALSLLLFLCVGYAAFSTNLTLTAKGNVKEKSRVIQSWDMNSQTDFHNDFYKKNIVSATFLDNNKVPSNAAESWNVSEDKENGGVLAWVIPNNVDNTKYDLYIGAQGGVIANEDSRRLFYDFINLSIVKFSNNFDTSNVTNMGGMFDKCTSLQTIDVNTFNTSNVTNMQWMFSHTKISILDLSSFNTSNVTNMQGMFMGCSNLTQLDISNFNTSKVTNMVSMFSMYNDISADTSTGNLLTIDVSSFNTKNVTDMSYMFAYNENLLEIKGLEKFDTSKVTNMEAMFSRLQNIQILNLCSFNTKNVTNMSYMFDLTFNLKNIYVGSNWNTTKANISYMFGESNISEVTKDQC